MPVKVCKENGCPLFPRIEVPYSGNKNSDIIWVGESPGKEEERKGKPFTGPSGQMAGSCCNEAKVDFREFFIINSARCLIDKKAMTAKEIASVLKLCRPKVERVINVLKPKLIIAAGDIALKQILKKSGITKLRGQYHWSQEFNCWVLPVFHPAYILRNRAFRPFLVDDLKSVREFIDNDYKPITADLSNRDYREVDDIKFLIDAGKPVSLDTEGQGLDWIDPDYVTISVSLSNAVNTGYDVVLYEECTKEESDFSIIWPRAPEGKKKKVPTEVFIKRTSHFERKLRQIRSLIESPLIRKYMMNGNFDIHSLNTLYLREEGKGIKPKGYSMDIQAAAHVIDENMYKMASLSTLQRAFTSLKEDYNREFALKYDKADMLAVPREERTVYACADADTTFRVAKGIKKYFNKKENRRMLNYVIKYVQPALQSLALLETTGAPIDLKALPEVKKEVHKLMMDAQLEALKQAPRSVFQVGDHPKKNAEKKDKDKIFLTRNTFTRDILFHKKGFNLKPIKFTKNKEPSMDKDTRTLLLDGRLSEKARKFIEKYSEFSEYHTLYSRYLNGFQKYIRHDGRIHSNFSLTVAVTGRVSSSKPNMMNNPKRSTSAKKIRRLIAAPRGWKILAADQGQSELRWAAHVSEDINMMRVFIDNEYDIHTATAMDLAGKTWAMWQQLLDEAKKGFRRDAKVVNFGLLFGMQLQGFLKYAKAEYGLDLTEEQGTQWINIFFRKYSRLKPYHQETIEFCRQHGYVESPLGRRRRLPEIHSTDKWLRMEAERQAINHPIQSPSSDTVIIALNEMVADEVFHPEEFMPIWFIHDELGFLVKDDKKKELDYGKTVKYYMENPPLYRDFGVKLKVPLEAEVESGYNAAQMEELKIAA